SYLCNTFFSTENMPDGLRQIVGILPLSQTSSMLRKIAAEESWSYTGILVLLIYLAVFAAAASWFLYKKKNL
ncbi:MAG: ABC transporter, partial [Lachnospiraceae bacterium]|nr:ABC transporter [Lachnospiraceae bacterium]